MNFLEKLSFKVTKNLPGEIAHFPLSPLGRISTSDALKKISDYKESAVSVILKKIEKEHQIILIQRPQYEGNHSNQISFPGGKMDKEDENLRQTAIRECQEEIGIELNSHLYIGNLSPVYIPVSNFYVEPHLFYINSIENLVYKPDAREVTEIVEIQTIDLLQDKNLTSTTIQISSSSTRNVPCFYINNKIIWGATALILNELKMILKEIDSK